MLFSFIIRFLIKHILLGLGLAADAFSVSLANGLNEPDMNKRRMLTVAYFFGLFQFLMPLIGFYIVLSFLNIFSILQRIIPWISLFLLLLIGIKMLVDGLKKKTDEDKPKGAYTIKTLFFQSIATSIDALSVGFTIANYDFLFAFLTCVIIGLVTFGTCFAGVAIGKKFGVKLANKASILGGVILIFIGIEIFISGLL